ncbi:hypothetical protein [Streptomyces sp. HYC2]|uniref:hypothetical protein n=1 Tax=Streptomyces sp. HYC2 TaxID=2955207 RepID=UPI00248020DC|nr:hypothetical protein [Streptomyces sp. HYC2]
MHPAPSTAPSSRALAFLTAALLTLLAVFTTGSPPPLPAAATAAASVADLAPGPRSGSAPGGGHPGFDERPADAPHAGQGCTVVCSGQDGTRQEFHGDRPVAHGQFATTDDVTDVPLPAPGRTRPVPVTVAARTVHVVQDGGRAPPRAFGI